MRLNLSGHLTDHITFCYTGGQRLERDRPTALFIHGAGHDHSVWTLQTRYFAHHGWNVIAPDLPGHGRSSGPAVDSIEGLAQWILALAHKLGTERPVVVGHSMGALIALQLAATAPKLVSRLALIGAVAPMPVAPALLDATLSNRDKAHALINQWSFAPSSQIGASSIPGMNLTALNERLMQRQAPGVLHTDMAACNAYSAGFDAAARVRCPTLLLSSAQDRMTPPKAIAPLAAAFDKSVELTRVVLPDAGHAMMSEAPGQVLDALWRFVNSSHATGQPPT
jgi:pimeloyl-ACP methyl ester carboxylesterase